MLFTSKAKTNSDYLQVYGRGTWNDEMMWVCLTVIVRRMLSLKAILSVDLQYIQAQTYELQELLERWKSCSVVKSILTTWALHLCFTLGISIDFQLLKTISVGGNFEGVLTLSDCRIPAGSILVLCLRCCEHWSAGCDTQLWSLSYLIPH